MSARPVAETHARTAQRSAPPEAPAPPASLTAVQRALAAHVQQGRTDLADALRDTPTFPARDRLAVYRDAYRLRTAEALRADFPALLGCVGRDAFDALCAPYVARHPSTSHTLADLGAHLPDWLRARRRPALAELAAFERALRTAFDAPDAAPMTRDTLAALGPALVNYAPRLHPAVRTVRLRWNTLAVWQAARQAGADAQCGPEGQARTDARPEGARPEGAGPEGGGPEGGRPCGPSPARLDRTVTVAVWRAGLEVRFRSLPADEAAAVRTVARGGDFAAVCAAVRRHRPAAETPARAATLLATWAHDGLLAAPA